MCDYLKRFLTSLAPIIVGIDSQKEELEKLKIELNDVKKFIEYVLDDVKKIGNYPNQEIVIKNLNRLKSEVSEYEAMVYLIENDNPNIQKLTQYQMASHYMRNILEYFKENFTNLTNSYARLSEEYQYKALAKKYYDLFQNDEMYIDDYNEFVHFFLTLDMSNEDKKDILSHVIKMNVDYYKNNLHEDIEIDREQDMRKIQEIIHSNKNLLNTEYITFVEKIEKQVNLSLPIKKIINHDVLEKIDIKNLMLAKTIYLINKISQNYKSCEFGLVSKHIKEYEELMVLKKQIENINDKEEIIKIIKGGY